MRGRVYRRQEKKENLKKSNHITSAHTCAYHHNTHSTVYRVSFIAIPSNRACFRAGLSRALIEFSSFCLSHTILAVRKSFWVFFALSLSIQSDGFGRKKGSHFPAGYRQHFFYYFPSSFFFSSLLFLFRSFVLFHVGLSQENGPALERQRKLL